MDMIASPGRRGFMLGMGAMLVLGACGKGTPVTHARVALPPEPTPDPAFLQLSQALTGKTDLSPTTAARMAQAFAKLQPEHHARFPALAGLVAQASSPAALIAVAGEAAPTALAIIAAWYTGTVGKGVDAVSVAYRDALMQRPVADGLAPATYALGGPGWWVIEPPPAQSAAVA